MFNKKLPPMGRGLDRVHQGGSQMNQVLRVGTQVKVFPWLVGTPNKQKIGPKHYRSPRDVGTPKKNGRKARASKEGEGTAEKGLTQLRIPDMCGSRQGLNQTMVREGANSSLATVQEPVLSGAADVAAMLEHN